MIYVEDGMHYTEAGERSYFARFDTDTVVDGTGTFHVWMRHGDEVTTR